MRKQNSLASSTQLVDWKKTRQTLQEIKKNLDRIADSIEFYVHTKT